MAGASPFTATLDGVRELEDAGSSAIVLPSLFEEQITESKTGRIRGVDPIDDAELARQVADFPTSADYAFGPDEYLRHVQRVKAAVRLPVIASLNGTSAGAWLRQATAIERAGADALELNLSGVLSDLSRSGQVAERSLVTALVDLKESLTIPVAVKLVPFFSAFANVAHQLDREGADGLILFGRFYDPDIDINLLTAGPKLDLSHRLELGLRLRWLAILHGRVRSSLAATGGVESWEDGVKAILAGAHVVQMVSALMRNGPRHLHSMVAGLKDWMTRHQFTSVGAFRGMVSLSTAPDPGNFERASYIRTVMSASNVQSREARSDDAP
jgi:dihydroorotate dehydrogenase (fumarate)